MALIINDQALDPNINFRVDLTASPPTLSIDREATYPPLFPELARGDEVAIGVTYRRPDGSDGILLAAIGTLVHHEISLNSAMMTVERLRFDLRELTWPGE